MARKKLTLEYSRKNFPLGQLTPMQKKVLNSPDAKLTKTREKYFYTVFSRVENLTITFSWGSPETKDWTIISIIPDSPDLPRYKKPLEISDQVNSGLCWDRCVNSK